MDFAFGLVVGLLVGFLLRWVLNPLLTSRQSAGGNEQDLLKELANVKQRLVTLEAKQAPSGSVDSGRAITRIIVRDRDDLTRINGIGLVFADRLNQAGIYTFEQLANTAPARLRQISAAEDWQAINVDGWINEARHRAADSKRTAE